MHVFALYLFILQDRKSPKWIATQGPLYRTFNEFWRMIYENNISYIVMLANLVERNIPKVDQYWPQHNFGPLLLKCLTVEMTYEVYVPDTNNAVIYRQFNIKPIVTNTYIHKNPFNFSYFNHFYYFYASIFIHIYDSHLITFISIFLIQIQFNS